MTEPDLSPGRREGFELEFSFSAGTGVPSSDGQSARPGEASTRFPANLVERQTRSSFEVENLDPVCRVRLKILIHLRATDIAQRRAKLGVW